MTMPMRGKPIAFRAVKEVWSTYTIKDKLPVQLKERVVLAKVLKTDMRNEVGEPVYVLGTGTPIVSIYAPPELQGPPTNPPPDQSMLAKADLVDLDFERTEEPWNEYEFADGTIARIRLVLSKIRRTPFYGLEGDPLYLVTNDIGSENTVPKELRQK